MTTVSQQTETADNEAPFINGAWRSVDNSTWSSIHSGVGTALQVFDYKTITVNPNNIHTDEYTGVGRATMGFDLTYIKNTVKTKYWDAVSATITMDILGATVSADLFGSTSGNGLGLVLLQDSSKTDNKAEVDDYQSMYNNSFVECAARVLSSSISAGSLLTFTFNSTGIDYINTVLSKSDKPGMAYFGVVIGGEIDGTTPTWPGGSGLVLYTIYGFPYTQSPTLNLTYDASYRLNIGDSWKDVSEISINIGNTWKAVDSSQINIGDSWKDI